MSRTKKKDVGCIEKTNKISDGEWLIPLSEIVSLGGNNGVQLGESDTFTNCQHKDVL